MKKTFGNIEFKSLAIYSMILDILLTIKFIVITYYINGSLDLAKILSHSVSVVDSFMFIAVNLFYIIGEEYGWIYFLQGRLQNSLGKIIGVIVTGVIWGLFHFPMYIAFENSLMIYSLLEIVVFCICFGIFLGFCYMKTKSLYMVGIFHSINNYLMIFPKDLFVSAEKFYTPNFYILSMGINLVLFIPFLFTKEFNKDNNLM